jgi:hypothetical protein
MFKAGLHVCSVSGRYPVWSIVNFFETPIFGSRQSNARARSCFVQPRLQSFIPLVQQPLSLVPDPLCDRPVHPPPRIDAVVSLFKHEQLPLGDYYF